jgi:hypothetical protein
MAHTHAPDRPQRSPRSAATRRLRPMSERQLTAYLLTRDALRRIRATSAQAADLSPRPPPSTARS